MYAKCTALGDASVISIRFGDLAVSLQPGRWGWSLSSNSVYITQVPNTLQGRALHRRVSILHLDNPPLLPTILACERLDPGMMA